MSQLLLNITDEKKAYKLIEFLKTLNYINIQEISEKDMISQAEKELMRKRLNDAKEDDFKNWDDIKVKFNL
jgi:hypothetical protein